MDYEKLQKKRNFWFGLSMMLIGVVVGYMMSPAKNGINVKNICGNGYLPKDCDDESNDDDYDECEENPDELKF